MAVNKTINKRTNTHGAMRNCIEYVLRQDKTSELLTYITGPYCHNEINYDLVYRTFLEEKKMWNKDTGRMYAHNIISWHKDEQITPEQAFEFGKEFAENWFSGFQTLVAVHKDKDHIHCHLVTNSVSYEDGRKLHNTRKDLERMKQLTNQMCRERGLTVAEKGKHFDGSQIEKGEVIAWSKDKYNLFRQQVKDSFVADCAMAVLKALENCISKEKFIEKMKQFGWNVNWTEKRKHITFQNQEGKKVRDSNLFKTFHLDISKEGLENEFNGNRKKARDSANRDSRSDEELAGYYRQVEAACEGAGGVTGASDGRERRVTGEKSEDERVYPEISGKDTQAENGKTELGSLIGKQHGFDTVKPVQLLKYLIQTFTDRDDIIFDFFSGSATTAQAVMEQNNEDSGHRKFVLMQIEEECDKTGEAYKAGFNTICDIGKARIKAAAQKLISTSSLSTNSFDGGFRIFKLDDSNMKDVYYAPANYDQGMLAMFESNIKEDRTDLDLLFGCLLEWGLPLSMPYASEQIEGCTVHTYNDGDLIACFDENIPDAVIKEIAKRQPLRVVFRDSSFNGSPAKINVGEIFKMLAPDTRVKVI